MIDGSPDPNLWHSSKPSRAGTHSDTEITIWSLIQRRNLLINMYTEIAHETPEYVYWVFNKPTNSKIMNSQNDWLITAAKTATDESKTRPRPVPPMSHTMIGSQWPLSTR